jgi:hypothetical protein
MFPVLRIGLLKGRIELPLAKAKINPAKYKKGRSLERPPFGSEGENRTPDLRVMNPAL